MDIWIIRDGEKIGPIHDFEIRRKISNGEISATTPAWHQGLDAWRPVVEIDLFTREFELEINPGHLKEPQEISTPPEADTTPPPLPKRQDYFRRFWARWLDLSLYSGVWWLGMWAAGQDIEAAAANPWIIFFRYVPWFALEAVLLQHFATTPGKWLLGLEVVNLDGSRLDLNAAIQRAMRVLFSGIGFGFSYLMLFCQLLSLVIAKRIGTTLWDQSGGHQVTAKPVQPMRLLAVVLVFTVAMLIHLAVFMPYIVKQAEEQNPELKGAYEKVLQWSLPKRK